MADTPDRRKGMRKTWIAITAFVAIATATGVFYFRALQARKRIEVIVSQIGHGDEFQRTTTIRDLYTNLTKPDEFAQVFPYLIQAMTDEALMVRVAAASVVGDLIIRFGSKSQPITDEREPTIVALCPKAEKAIAVLLNESSQTQGCDLRLLPSITDVTGIPTAGKSLIIVAAMDLGLQFRVFNGDGKMVVDLDEKRLTDRALQIEALRKALERFWPPHELTKNETDDVITAVTSIVDRSPELRARAAKSLGLVAEIGKLDAPPPGLVACLDDEAEPVRIAAANALLWYRQGPELLVPVALRRLPSESPSVHEAFTEVFWFVRLEPSVLPILMEGLSSENTAVRLSCTAAINHMGRDARPALPAILMLIRRELESSHPRQRIIAMASGAIGELSSDTDPLPGAVETLCEVLQRPNEATQASDANRPASAVASAEALTNEERLAEAAWSLGILGRSAASAVPVLLSTFQAAPDRADNLREIIAESLAEISRGTPDEDRVIACLAKAWRTSPKEQKAVIARALRSLAPKSEQIVPELRQLPPDKTRSQIRRVRYPRSRRGQPVRE